MDALSLRMQIISSGFSSNVIHQDVDQIHFNINNVKLTFYQYPFAIPANLFHENYFRIPNLPTLAAMKALALVGRGKWKDYVDLYFLIKYHISVQLICDKAKELFTDVFNSTLFNKQLCYFKDIRYDEPVEFMPGFEVSEEEVKAFLTDAALTGF